MERRNFLKGTAAMAAVTVTGSSLTANNLPAQDNEFYEFRIYQLTGGGAKNTLKSYFTEALMPLFNKSGIGIYLHLLHN